MKISLVLSLQLFVFGAHADYTATLFAQESKQVEKLYTFELKSVTNPNSEVESVVVSYKDLAGTLVFEEKAQIATAGAQLIKTEIFQNQLKQTAVIEVKGDEIHFSKTEDGKTKTSIEKKKGIFVASAIFQKFVKEHWSELSSGKTVDFRYAVWDRMETVGFSLFKIADETVRGQKALVFKMKPSSFIIAALVKPVIFKFNEDGSKLLEMNGRVAPKKKEGGSWKDLDAEVVYTYP